MSGAYDSINLMDVSIVVLSYNVGPLLKICLDSIVKFTKNVNYEVIVVDNASTDDSPEIIKSLDPQVYHLKTIFSQENGGYTKGNNLGIRAAKGKYVLVQNPDTELLENSVERLFLWMEAHSDVAAVAPMLLDSEHNLSPIASGGYFPSLWRVAQWAFFLDDLPLVSKFFKSYHPHTSMDHWRDFFGDLPVTRKIMPKKEKKTGEDQATGVEKEMFPDWVHGSYWMVRKDAINQVGLLDEKIFMYGEELEWCLRAKKAGWKVGYTPITKVVHLERKSSGGAPRNAILGEYQGLKYIYGKHYPIWAQLVLGSILDVAAFLRILFWLVRMKPQMVKVYGEALLL